MSLKIFYSRVCFVNKIESSKLITSLKIGFSDELKTIILD